MEREQTIQAIAQELQDASIDCDLIISHVLQKERAFVLAHPDHVLTQEQAQQITRLIRRRKDGEPLAYILGTKEFYGRDFVVTPATLIPRPETEHLIDLVEKRIRCQSDDHQKIIIDIGTGSGNIIITLAKQLSGQNISFIATDQSQAALTIAQENAQKHHVYKEIDFFHGNLLSPAKDFLRRAFATTPNVIITANLPYVDIDIKEKLLQTKESRGLTYEPQEALWSDNQGLAHYKALLVQTKKTITEKSGVSLYHSLTNYYEINPDQKDLLEKEILVHFPTASIIFHKDLANKWRVCEWSL